MAYTTINKPADYFEPVLYSGDDTNNRTINTTENFQADLFWIKDRGGAGFHIWNDVIRSSGWLSSNTTNAESAYSALGWDNTAPASTGFTVDKGTNGTINGSGNSFVSWCWNAGGTASSNTDGSITSSVSANTTSGFSIVSYTGTGANASVGHGLGVAPDCIIVKRREDAGRGWWVYHKDLGETKAIYLHDTAASFTNDWLQDTAPTSTVFTLDNNSDTNGSSKTHIAYCFAEKKGYSKFGSYTGNGNADGTFVYTGFKPAWVLFKNTTDAGDNWIVHDTKRDLFNVTDNGLAPNSSASEFTDVDIDILSNGFKIRNTTGRSNGSGKNYIYMAFAENPLVTSGGTPATAR